MLSEEQKQCLLDALEVIHNTNQVAKIFHVNQSTVSRIHKQIKTTGSIALRTSQRGRKASLKEADVRNICDLVDKQPDITINEIVETLHLSVCGETVRKKLVSLGYVYKKKSLHASEQERPRCGGEKKALARDYVWLPR